MPVDDKVTFRQFLAGILAIAAVAGYITTVVYIGLALFDKSINDAQFAFVLFFAAISCTGITSMLRQK